MRTSGLSRALLVPVTFLAAACMNRAALEGAPPASANADLSYYDAPGPVPEATSVRLEREEAGLDVLRIRLPPRVPADLQGFQHARDPIDLVWLRPRPRGGTPRPLVLLQTILGNDMTLMPEFARGFIRLGYHAVVLKRMDFDFHPETAIEDAEREFRLLVMRGRQALDWLATREEVDASRFATFGVSAGAVLSACLAGADPRPRAHVLVLAGGPLADVLSDTEEKRFRKYGERLRKYTGWTQEEIRARLLAAVRTDPVRLAPNVPRERVLLFVAKDDRSIPTRTGMALWRALGKPELRTLPFGHYLSFLALPWIQSEVNDFLHARLGPP